MENLSDSLPLALRRTADQVHARLRKRGVKLTLGGEPTYVPDEPEGPEWNFAALGPTKLGYANALAKHLIAHVLPGAITLYSPGKLYPGETNPRWVINVLWNRDGVPIVDPGSLKTPAAITLKLLEAFKEKISKGLKLPAGAWLTARESKTRGPSHPVYVLPLDYNEEKGKWRTDKWKVPSGRTSLPLIDAAGPAGLRLPLGMLPPEALRRALSLELRDGVLYLFVPPLMEDSFGKLLTVAIKELQALNVTAYQFEGYLPAGEGRWHRLGLTADPGVLEVNLPPCETWMEYAAWLATLEKAAGAVGLRSYKVRANGEQAGTGGGNHLLFGGPSLEENPFFTRPAWLASMLRYFQAHPSLAYLFTGQYVGASSQAPRPDESACDFFDLDMAYRYLASLPSGEDHRAVIGETLRHLHTDTSGNTHRSESSFDKFWNGSGLPGSCAGLIEFRALESLPRADWMARVGLLWQAIAIYTLEQPSAPTLISQGARLHDAFFLPTRLWADLRVILNDLSAAGFPLDEEGFREIWQWRFPLLARVELPEGAHVEVRRACEGWPLLCEMPIDGGTTSRFVDSSMERLEFVVQAGFQEKQRLFVNGRELTPLPLTEGGVMGCGLRFRRTALYPSLHPGIPPHLPLEVCVTDRGGKKRLATWALSAGEPEFHAIRAPSRKLDLKNPCLKSNPELLTYDLRLTAV